MADVAGSVVGAMPTADPLQDEPQLTSQQSSSTLRYATFDNEAFSLYSTSSPSRAKRALEAHLKDTDRRIQDASRLGTTLLQQRKELSARLKDVEEVESDSEVPEDLRKKLTDLEKEYNEVGKETARAFLPKARVPSDNAEKSVLSASGRESPTKMTAPSRRQRNVPTNRIHDIEFAAEISTSLLAQVRQLQAALIEKDDALKGTNSAKAELETELYNVAQRMKRLDENEQRFKDENWTLETRLQELEAGLKESTDQENRLNAGLKAAHSDKQQAQRELDSLKAAHEKLNEDHSLSKKQQETDMHGLRRDISLHQTENQSLHKKIQELTSQNSELAKAVSYRLSQPGTASDREFVTADEDAQDDDLAQDHFDAASPIKGTPRHGGLESETLKSSLNHAHRMIQNLKSNIHREKTEKIELKRMLQDARDELETCRGDGAAGAAAGLAKRRRGEVDALKFKKPNRPDRLGVARGSTTEYLDSDPEWEDHDGERTPSKSAFIAAAAASAAAATRRDDTESTDAFETANELNTTTENESFETGTEGLAGDDSDDLTETEGSVRRGTLARKDRAGTAPARDDDSYSYLSTASTSDEEAENEVQTTPQNDGSRYRPRASRISRRSQRGGDTTDSPGAFHPMSPVSSVGTPRPVGQSLGDELDALDDESVEGTPSRLSESDYTPNTVRQTSVEPVTPSRAPLRPVQSSEYLGVDSFVRQTQILVKPAMADAGVMTEPWEPAQAPAEDKTSLVARAGGIVGGVLAGVGLDRLGQRVTSSTSQPEAVERDVVREASEESQEKAAPIVFAQSEIIYQDTEPVIPVLAEEKASTSINSLAVPLIEPTKAVALESEPQIPFTHAEIVSCETVPIARVDSPVEPTSEAPLAASQLRPGALPEPSLSFSSIESQEFAPSIEHQFRSEKRNGVYYEGRIPPTAIYANGAAPVTGAQEHAERAKEEPSVSLSEASPENTRNGTRIAFQDDFARGDDEHVHQDTKKVLATGGIATPAALLEGRAVSRSQREDAQNDVFVTRRAASPTEPTSEPPIGMASSTEGNVAVDSASSPRSPKAGSNTMNNIMGPPLMPASAYKNLRPKTPSKDTTGARPFKIRDGRHVPQSPSNVSRRTSMSSFVSEIDDRFNMRRGQLMYGDIESGTDPRMIQAITQTMIGEYLWKYTRKAGRNETSTSRHRRFFWVHPYTRTLYWSEQDPSTAGRNMLKAKSVAIDSVRVITDDNTYPPGLHRKSIVVVTPGREIVFTAPTGQRHETWFNALSYLLLRSEQEKAEMDDAFNAKEAEERAGGFSIRRSLSRAAGRDTSQSRQSLSSYNSRTTRASSPQRGGAKISIQRPPVLHQDNSPAASPKPRAPPSRDSDLPAETSTSRFSTLTGRFRTTGGTLGSAHRRGRASVGRAQSAGIADPADIYDASVVNDSAEDLRAEMERQEREADRVENVRACCDGKHDVGALENRSGRHSSFGRRLGGGGHSHSHTHQHATDSVRSRA